MKNIAIDVSIYFLLGGLMALGFFILALSEYVVNLMSNFIN